MQKDNLVKLRKNTKIHKENKNEKKRIPWKKETSLDLQLDKYSCGLIYNYRLFTVLLILNVL